jgi:hypothetical protein
LRGGDKRKAYLYASALCECDAAIECIIEAAQLEAEHVLQEHEPIFHALIDKLLEQGRMGPETILYLEKQAVRFNKI